MHCLADYKRVPIAAGSNNLGAPNVRPVGGRTQPQPCHLHVDVTSSGGAAFLHACQQLSTFEASRGPLLFVSFIYFDKPFRISFAFSRPISIPPMSPPMLDREIAVDGWRSAWLARDAPVFDIYLCSTLLILSLTTFSINLTASIKSRRDARTLEENPNNRASLFARAIRRGINVCRANWVIAVFYLLNALFLACVDAWIGVMAIKKDVGENAGEYDAGFWWELAAYCAYVFVIFFSTLVIVPALQILAATAILARFMRKRGVSTLAEYVPQARAFSTHIAQSWALVTFAIMALWEPMVGVTSLAPSSSEKLTRK